MIIGICGKSGSGKSTLAKAIINKTNNKAIHLDIDKVGHEVLTFPDVKNDLVLAFGNTILENDCINRKKLGSIVFSSKDEMDKLTEITWKYMQIEIDKFIKANKDKIILLDWLLLPLSKYFDTCDLKILLDIPYEVRKNRAIKRDSITDAEFDLRDSASICYDKDLFDYILSDDCLELESLVKLL